LKFLFPLISTKKKKREQREQYKMSFQHNQDLINSLTCSGETNPIPVPERVFFSEDGAVYRYLQETKQWLVLTNKNSVCGWYHVDSPYVHEYVGEQKRIILPYSKSVSLSPSTYGLKVFRVKNIHYCLCPSESGDAEEIHLYLKTNDNTPTLVGHMYPLIDRDDNEWTDPYHLSQQGWLNWVVSAPLSNLREFNPTSYAKYATYMDYESVNYYEEAEEGEAEEWSGEEAEEWSGEEAEEEWGEAEEWSDEEYRVDPFNNMWYTKHDFTVYYGDTLFWDMLSPEKVSQRFMLETMIRRNKCFLSTKNVNHLLDKMIATFM